MLAHHIHNRIGEWIVRALAPVADSLLAWDATARVLRFTNTLTGLTLTAPTIVDFTNAAHDHGDADDGGAIVVAALPQHGAAEHTDRTRTIWIPASDFVLDGATRAVRGTLPNGYEAVQLDNVVTEGCYVLTKMPSEATAGQTPTFTLVFAGDGAAAANVRIESNILAGITVAGSSLVALGTTEGYTHDVSATADLAEQALNAFNGGTASANNLVRLHVQRLGGDAADTYAGALFFVGAYLNFTGDS